MTTKSEGLISVLAAALLIFTSGCERTPTNTKETTSSTNAAIVQVDTGLTPEEVNVFLKTPLGTGFIPEAAFWNMESVSGRPFSESMDRFGFLYPAGARDAKTLPVGFVTEQPKGVPVRMIGLNCAACHVGELHFQGRKFRIVGAPNRVDVVRFQKETIASVMATLENPAKAFALLRNMTAHRPGHRAVSEFDSLGSLEESGELGSGIANHLKGIVDDERSRLETAETPHAQAHEQLAQTLGLSPFDSSDTDASQVDALTQLISSAHDTDSSVFGDIDTRELTEQLRDLAEGWRVQARLLLSRAVLAERMIETHVATTVPGPGRVDAFGGFRNLLSEPRPLTAPAAMPPLWNLEDIAYYQWNANNNTNIQRNLVAAIGIGGVFDDKTGATSVRLDNAFKVEALTARIDPPIWPDAFPEIDRALADAGKPLYEAKCAQCHDGATRNEKGLVGYPEYPLAEIGTDPNLAANFALPAADGPFVELLQTELQRIQDAYIRLNDVNDETRRAWEPESREPNVWRSPQSYPARPLSGVWATAPYLHNDSVPTIYDLLLPPDERPTTFDLGSREYDARKLGIAQTSDSAGPTQFDLDTTLPGNSNAGHDYGTDLADSEKTALLEYIKTLGPAAGTGESQ